MLLLGIDLGTSSVKVSVVEAGSQQILASASYPETEAPIHSPQPGWAEQDPNQWWEFVTEAILRCHRQGSYDPHQIRAIGIAYQMHGLVMLDKEGRVIRPAIIWCDSRAVPYGEKALATLGSEYCLSTLLNSPGNFTAAKLAWVKDQEPDHYKRVDKIMLPGDFIAYRLTGSLTTTPSALSEGIFWDFQQNQVSSSLLNHFGFEAHMLPPVQPVFETHGELSASIAASLGLEAGIPVSYKAGDQPNNALSLNVLQPGEVAATAGTSGVIYGVTDKLDYDPLSRINGFAHVNHQPHQPRIGILLCLNAVGIFNKWMRQLTGSQYDYPALNALAASVPAGSEGLVALPFGNGAERIFQNRILGAHFHQIDLNLHHTAHLVRAVQEGIAFSFRYGLDIMRENGMHPTVVRAGKSNLFQSDVFSQTFANTCQVAVEFYEGDGSYGAAIGAGIGAGIYRNAQEAFSKRQPLQTISPEAADTFEALYQRWKSHLEHHLETNPSSFSPNKAVI